MSRKRIPNKEIKAIAKRRVDRLLRLAEREALNHDQKRANRYMVLARRIAGRNKVSVPKGTIWCRGCEALLVPGRNCRIRLRGERINIHCLECDSIRRLPYNKEKKERRACQREV